jgi:hypothetical protein
MNLFKKQNDPLAGKSFYIAPTSIAPPHIKDDTKNKRGINVYTSTQLLGVTGKTRHDKEFSGTIEWPIFGLSIEERIAIFQINSDVLGIVGGRANKLSGFDVKVIPDKEREDIIVAEARNIKQIIDEYEGQTDIQYIVTRGQLINLLMQKFPELTPNLSNFESAILRWSRNISMQKKYTADQIEDWLAKPNPDDNWTEFTKKWVTDYYIHGNAANYKKFNLESGRIDTVHRLPGGSIFPFRMPFVENIAGYFQFAQGFEPLIYFNDEVTFNTFLPASFSSYGIVPLDALVNKITESLLFDWMMANQADGTKPPEKVVVFSDPDPIGDLSESLGMATDSAEQKRIEQKFNEAREGAIATMTGKGNVAILDLSKQETMALQTERQKEARKSIALVFSASNLEVNETGSDSTSGRVPYKFGYGFSVKIQAGIDEFAKYREAKEMLETNAMDVNYVRKTVLGLPPYDDKQYDRPQGAAPAPVNGQGGGFF